MMVWAAHQLNSMRWWWCQWWCDVESSALRLYKLSIAYHITNEEVTWHESDLFVSWRNGATSSLEGAHVATLFSRQAECAHSPLPPFAEAIPKTLHYNTLERQIYICECDMLVVWFVGSSDSPQPNSDRLELGYGESSACELLVRVRYA